MKRLALLSLVSGVLLTLSYPYPGWGWLAWFSLIPLLYAVRSASSLGRAFFSGCLSGFVFYALSMHWLVHVTTLGWLLVAVIEAFSMGIFTVLVYFAEETKWTATYKILWVACVWTLVEFVRSEIPVFGLGWNLLAYSQAAYPAIIQMANITGAYSLSFVIVLVNGLLANLFSPEKKKKGVAAVLFFSSLLIFMVNYLYGTMRLAGETKPEEYLRISVLQGNIPQSLKWALVAKEKTVEIYSKLSELAALEQTDLIVWPEAAFPGYFNRDTEAASILELARDLSVPMLVGGLHWAIKGEIYNSAYFIDKQGAVRERYDKIYLVPFGEYIPLKPLFFWLVPVADVLGIGDFCEGKEPKVFRWAREEWPFGVLICFEDVVPSLARTLANRSAKFLTVITNDAWFMDTGAPFQHLQASIFRAVENGIPVVRAANTGISGFISWRGESLDSVKNGKGKETFVAGCVTYDLPLMNETTLYRQGGWMFPYAVLGIFLILSFSLWVSRSHE